jgi:hypothetical protein
VRALSEVFRESLKGGGSKMDEWINYFCDTHSGHEYVTGWTPGVGVETTAGVDKPAINDKALAAAVFAIWWGEKPIREELKKDLVSRKSELRSNRL